MEIFFLGVGEACDPGLGNTSLLVALDGQEGPNIMLDCGFTTPHRYFQHCDDPEILQAVWISHFHGDHFFGMPLLLLRFWEMGRQSPLSIIGPAGLKVKVLAAMDLAYPDFAAKLRYPLNFVEFSSGEVRSLAGASWACAANDHGQAALALRLDHGGSSIYYSGDGRATPQGRSLARGCRVIVHEAFRWRGSTPGHGSVQACLELAMEAGAHTLALVHMERNDRRSHGPEIKTLKAPEGGPRIVLPDPGTSLQV